MKRARVPCPASRGLHPQAHQSQPPTLWASLHPAGTPRVTRCLRTPSRCREQRAGQGPFLRGTVRAQGLGSRSECRCASPLIPRAPSKKFPVFPRAVFGGETDRFAFQAVLPLGPPSPVGTFHFCFSLACSAAFGEQLSGQSYCLCPAHSPAHRNDIELCEGPQIR